MIHQVHYSFGKVLNKVVGNVIFRCDLWCLVRYYNALIRNGQKSEEIQNDRNINKN